MDLLKDSDITDPNTANSLAADSANASAISAADESAARAHAYTILAAFFAAAPSAELILYLQTLSIPNSDGEVGAAWLAAKTAIADYTQESLDDEYHDLFIGLGRGEVVPFGSWHITGFLMDQPLSDLRDDLRALGIESNENQKDPEDHIAAVFETMALLIESDDVQGFQQRRFFLKHINPWADKFFTEVQQAKTAKFYRHLGLLGQRFLAIENQYLNIQSE